MSHAGMPNRRCAISLPHTLDPAERATSGPAEISLIDIYRAFGPFVCLQLLFLIAVLFFPWLATTLL
jgi:TRAP-type mannitol/chloroaromatic compound transport system permease large subunit